MFRTIARALFGLLHSVEIDLVPSLGFRARVVEIPLRDGLLRDAMARTRAIFDLSDAPDGAAGCTDCPLVLDLAETLWPGISDVDLVEKLQRMLANRQPSVGS